ncbi:MAG: threonylcarbamoyl-AMP synthase [Leptospiraceae bacterium]|nr:threonylcarbamoyl-AMP synthase [Leptospiraceae bacterium]MCP5502701.1 threonylcarbamoyl-AMP synthase [Leptospiraceae bacterium]
MLEYLHPVNPEIRKLKQISEDLKDGAVYIFPTDTAYALIADSLSHTGVEKIFNIKKIDKTQHLSILCSDISMASGFIEYLPNDAFRFMKRLTPGPFTFIFRANKNIPRVTLSNRKCKSLGVRIPDNIYIQELLKIHGRPLTSTSVVTGDEGYTDVGILDDIYGSKVRAVFDGGIVDTEFSTVLDFTGDEMVILRKGKGAELLELVHT